MRSLNPLFPTLVQLNESRGKRERKASLACLFPFAQLHDLLRGVVEVRGADQLGAELALLEQLSSLLLVGPSQPDHDLDSAYGKTASGA